MAHQITSKFDTFGVRHIRGQKFNYESFRKGGWGRTLFQKGSSPIRDVPPKNATGMADFYFP